MAEALVLRPGGSGKDYGGCERKAMSPPRLPLLSSDVYTTWRFMWPADVVRKSPTLPKGLPGNGSHTSLRNSFRGRGDDGPVSKGSPQKHERRVWIQSPCEELALWSWGRSPSGGEMGGRQAGPWELLGQCPCCTSVTKTIWGRKGGF